MEIAMKPTVLWADDDPFIVAEVAAGVADFGFRITHVSSLSDAKAVVSSGAPIAGCILDVMMPLGVDDQFQETKGGYESGLVLARWIRADHIHLPIIGYSVVSTTTVVDWFRSQGNGYIQKTPFADPRETARQIAALLRGDYAGACRVFLVHGKDRELLNEVKSFLDRAGFRDVIVLEESAGSGRTIIENLEVYTASANLALVLLTPEDTYIEDDGRTSRRARQNVVLELGFLLGRASRQHGGVIVLYKAPLKIPSELDGLVFVDVSGGFAAAEERLRDEIRRVVPRLTFNP
jgi:CheY-like chemotaxis protein